MIIVRGLAGLILGIGYGVVAGGLAFLLFAFTIDVPGPMIPDNYGWARIATVATALIAGVCGALVGLVVGLSGVEKTRAGMIGGAFGLMILTTFLLSPWADFAGLSWSVWKEFLGVCLFLLLLFPIGLTLTGIVVSVVTHKLTS